MAFSLNYQKDSLDKKKTDIKFICCLSQLFTSSRMNCNNSILDSAWYKYSSALRVSLGRFFSNLL